MPTTNSPKGFFAKEKKPQQVNNCTVQTPKTFSARTNSSSLLFFKRGFVDSLVKEPSFYLFFRQINDVHMWKHMGTERSSLKKTPQKKEWMKVLHHEAESEKPTGIYCQSYLVCNKTSNLTCNAYSKKKKIAPLSASWSPVNWNLSFPLLFTCNQTGEISVNLFPNILAMS